MIHAIANQNSDLMILINSAVAAVNGLKDYVSLIKEGEDICYVSGDCYSFFSILKFSI